MDTENNKKITPGIDEELMMNLMVDGVKKEGLRLPEDEPKKEKAETKKSSSRKAHENPDYEGLFFKDVKSTARHGKSVYIDPDHHKKLSRIVQVIGDNEITIYAYLYNLLDHHFKEFEQQITVSFNEKNKPLF
ncbi:DUF3408 domain-containing protein [Sphingobacterium mizutaii]|uniref:DUF3408 domain-containing protein n=1 Tax=Sphingobacterium mizutaii TaxID=1010 RepID=UPI0016283A33|nr:DUF3408 domain-containing protein [Sphingobacterium mizutaii]